MTAPSTIPDAIEQNALGPKKVKVRDQEVEQHSLQDQIEADRYNKGQTAATRNHFGIRFGKIDPPGCG